MPPFALRHAKGSVGALVRAVTPSQEQLDLHPEWTAGQADDQLEQLKQLRERQEQLQRRQEEVECVLACPPLTICSNSHNYTHGTADQ